MSVIAQFPKLSARSSIRSQERWARERITEPASVPEGDYLDAVDLPALRIYVAFCIVVMATSLAVGYCVGQAIVGIVVRAIGLGA